MNHPIITPGFIRTFNPCYDPSRYLAEDYCATVVEFLRHPEIPARDKIWLMCQSGVMDDKILRVFTADCIKRALSYVGTSNTCSVGREVAERYANGNATLAELNAVSGTWGRSHAGEAAGAAAWFAEWNSTMGFAKRTTMAEAGNAERQIQIEYLITLLEVDL